MFCSRSAQTGGKNFNKEVSLATITLIDDHLRNLQQAGEDSDARKSMQAITIALALTKIVCYGPKSLDLRDIHDLSNSG